MNSPCVTVEREKLSVSNHSSRCGTKSHSLALNKRMTLIVRSSFFWSFLSSLPPSQSPSSFPIFSLPSSPSSLPSSPSFLFNCPRELYPALNLALEQNDTPGTFVLLASERASVTIRLKRGRKIRGRKRGRITRVEKKGENRSFAASKSVLKRGRMELKRSFPSIILYEDRSGVRPGAAEAGSLKTVKEFFFIPSLRKEKEGGRKRREKGKKRWSQFLRTL